MNEKVKIKQWVIPVRNDKGQISFFGCQNCIEEMVRKAAIWESENKHRYRLCFPENFFNR